MAEKPDFSAVPPDLGSPYFANLITTFHKIKMAISSLFKIGDLSICLHACTPYSNRLLDQFRRLWNSYGFHIFQYSDEEIRCCQGDVWYLAIVSPHKQGEETYPTWLSENERRVYDQIHRKWATTLSLMSDSHTPAKFQCLRLRPRLYIGPISYNQSFCLVDNEPHAQRAVAILLHSIMLATWWHVLRDGLCLHSAAVVHGDSGYIFLGDSEAGKTTVAKLSNAFGYPALGDDLNMLIRNEENSYRLAAIPSPVLSPVEYSMLRPSLRGVFALVQDDCDYLVPMAPIQTARALFDSFMQTPCGGKLPDDVIGLAFRTCCDIARRVSGYKLHFRKSPEFWKVINERFSE